MLEDSLENFVFTSLQIIFGAFLRVCLSKVEFCDSTDYFRSKQAKRNACWVGPFFLSMQEGLYSPPYSYALVCPPLLGLVARYCALNRWKRYSLLIDRNSSKARNMFVRILTPQLQHYMCNQFTFVPWQKIFIHLDHRLPIHAFI